MDEYLGTQFNLICYWATNCNSLVWDKYTPLLLWNIRFFDFLAGTSQPIISKWRSNDQNIVNIIKSEKSCSTSLHSPPNIVDCQDISSFWNTNISQPLFWSYGQSMEHPPVLKNPPIFNLPLCLCTTFEPIVLKTVYYREYSYGSLMLY